MSNRSEEYFYDYDLYKRQGIGEINRENKANILREKNRYLVLIYNNTKLDTIVINNLFGKHVKAVFQVIQNDSVSIFKTSYSFLQHGREISFYVFYKDSAIDYRFFPDEVFDGNRLFCDITLIKSDGCNGGLKLLKHDDTLNFVHNLLKRKKIPIYESIHSVQFSNRLTKKFTFLDWFNYEDAKILY